MMQNTVENTHTPSVTHTRTHTHFTFWDFEFVVLLVPEAAPVAVGYPDRELCVWAVRRLQAEVSGCTECT